MKTHKFPFSVAYADTDAGGIMYHGRYVEIAERARMQWLRNVEFPDGDIGFVVRELGIKYFKPLRLGEDFFVESHIKKVGNASLDAEQKFIKDDTICAIMNINIAYIGSDLHPKRIPDNIMTKLS